MRSRFSSLFIAATATLTVATASPYAHAIGEAEASPKAKGIIGGALLGGETVMLVEAAAGVRSPWAYVGGGLVGAAAGGVGGHFIEKDADSAKLPMFLVAGGMILIIPTWVAVAATTAYKPPANYVEDRPPADEPVAEPPQPATPPGSGAAPAGGSGPTSRRMRTRTPRDRNHAEVARVAMYKPLPAYIAPPSLVGVAGGGLSLSVPSVELHDLYSRREMLQTGVKQVTEVRIPVFNLTF